MACAALTRQQSLDLEYARDQRGRLIVQVARLEVLDRGPQVVQRPLAAPSQEEVLARDLNGLLTVARLSENTLRVRLGAMQAATADYAMVPRNHNVTLLLMVPEGAGSTVQVVARTELVDTETGEELLVDTGSTAVREQLLERARRHDRRLERSLRQSGVDLVDVDATGSYVEPLHRFFAARTGRRLAGGAR